MKQNILNIAAILMILGISFFMVDQYQDQNALLNQFSSWKTKFNIQYQSHQEDLYRQAIFFNNLKDINEHNANPKRTYDQGINQFTPYTQKQLQLTYLNLQVPSVQIKLTEKFEISHNNLNNEFEGQIDWRTKGAVTPIADQGSCGSSPYFSGVYALQGLMKIADGTLDVLSVQQIIDCSGPYGNYGCNGGWMVSTFKYVIDKGIATAKEYPYKGVQQKCQKDGGKFKVTGYVQIPTNDCNALAQGLMKNPIATAAQASNWFKYQSGIFSDCKETNPNHGIAMIGMAKDYWIMKNTWAATWGQSGYIRLARGNTCGVCTYASYPTK